MNAKEKATDALIKMGYPPTNHDIKVWLNGYAAGLRQAIDTYTGKIK